MKIGKVLLITGPAASGKSTLADSVAQLPGWVQLSEDAFYTRHGWHGHRTEEKERVVQQDVAHELLELTRSGKDVVLEFILYKNPPNPLTNYIDLLSAEGLETSVVALKPDVDTVIRQMKQRGRASDLADLTIRREQAASQIACLEDTSIDPVWIINTPGLSASAVFTRVKQQMA